MSVLSISSIISQGVTIGIKNLVSLIVNLLLYALTIWIPYLNIGTTIGLIGLVPKMSKGEVVSPLEIFNPVYRKKMGEFFLTVGLMYMGLLGGFALFLIPGIVISIAWCLVVYLVLEKGLNPLDAMRKSNDLTYGKKWTIFLGVFILKILLLIALFIISVTLGKIPVLGALILFVAALAGGSIIMGAMAHIYGALVK